MWSFLAHVMVTAHYAFMAYLVVGGFLAWRWRRTIFLHLAAVTWAVLIVVEKWQCPLTIWQNWFREQAGQPRLAHGFITDYLQGVFFPANHETIAQAVLAVVVLSSWAGYVWLGRRARARRRDDHAVTSPMSSSARSPHADVPAVTRAVGR